MKRPYRSNRSFITSSGRLIVRPDGVVSRRLGNAVLQHVSTNLAPQPSDADQRHRGRDGVAWLSGRDDVLDLRFPPPESVQACAHSRVGPRLSDVPPPEVRLNFTERPRAGRLRASGKPRLTDAQDGEQFRA